MGKNNLDNPRVNGAKGMAAMSLVSPFPVNVLLLSARSLE